MDVSTSLKAGPRTLSVRHVECVEDRVLVWRMSMFLRVAVKIRRTERDRRRQDRDTVRPCREGVHTLKTHGRGNT